MSSRFQALFRYSAIIVAAAVFSWGLHQVWDLELRWFMVVALAIVLASLAMSFAAVFSDFLLLVLFFTLPVASFVKWFWVGNYDPTDRGYIVYGGALGLGLMDFIIVGLYANWFWRIFVSRTAPPTRFDRMDIWVLAFVLIHVVSSIGAQDSVLGLGSAQYIGKYALLYLYLTRHLQQFHLPWLVGAFCFTIAVEGILGGYQYATGNLVGIALDKGAGDSIINYQYVVPGLESTFRATGTTYDSHALGDLAGMLFAFAFSLFIKPGQWKGARYLFGFFSALALATVVLSLSRAAWIAVLAGLLIGLFLMVVKWRDPKIVRLLVISVTVAGIATAPMLGYFYDRFAASPIGTITTRFDSYIIALRIWQSHPIVGVGPANSVLAARAFSDKWVDELMVHNAVLLFAVEMGLLGVICYFGILVSAFRRLVALCKSDKGSIAGLAMAGVIALATNTVDWLSAPAIREPSCWLMLWLIFSLAVALTRHQRGEIVEPYAPFKGPQRRLQSIYGMSRAGPATSPNARGSG